MIWHAQKINPVNSLDSVHHKTLRICVQIQGWVIPKVLKIGPGGSQLDTKHQGMDWQFGCHCSSLLPQGWINCRDRFHTSSCVTTNRTLTYMSYRRSSILNQKRHLLCFFFLSPLSFTLCDSKFCPSRQDFF